jgi:hypothetical protein
LAHVSVVYPPIKAYFAIEHLLSPGVSSRPKRTHAIYCMLALFSRM